MIIKPFFLLVCTSVIFTCKNALGQEPTYIQYLVSDGLPSSEVYQSIQDDRGIMWFGTDGGLVRFDGYEFQVYTTKDGLGSNVIFGFHKDHNNRIWFYLYNGGIGYLQNDQIVIPEYNDLLKEKLGALVITSMYVGPDNIIWLASKKDYFTLRFNSDDKLEDILHHNVDEPGFITLVDSIGYIFDATHQIKKKGKFITIIGFKEPVIKNLPNYKFPLRLHRTNSLKTTKGIINTQNDLIFHYKDSSVIQQRVLPDIATLSIYEDNQSNIWVGMYQQGAMCFPKGNFKSKPSQYLINHSVSSIYEDSFGGIWFTTLDAGIFYAINLDIKAYKFGNNIYSEPISSLCVYDSMLWIGTSHGSVFRQEALSNSKSELIYENLGEIYDIKKSKNKLYIGSKNKIPSSNISFTDVIFTTWKIGLNIQNDSIWSIDYSPKQKSTSFEKFIPELVNSKIQCTFLWKDTIYIGTYKGLYFLENNKTWKSYPLPFQPWILDAAATDSSLYLATKEHGIFIINDGKIFSINESDGLLTNNIRNITLDNNQNIWVGTKKGVNKIQLNRRNNVKEITKFTTSEGLISDEVNQILCHNDLIWVATNQGLSQFDSEHLFFNSTPPPIYLTKVKVNEAYHEFESLNNFDHSSKVFNFEFTGINYRGNGNTKYRYRLRGHEKNWNETFNCEARYILSPGEYNFEVIAQSSSGIWSIDPATYNFTINAPIWQRWWFIALIISIISILAYYAFNRRILALEKEASLKIKMAQSQHQALSAQLKPHFVFNVINSIHNYIRKNDKSKSSEYLLLFSKLIRQILTNSQEHLITIDQEIQLVESYLQVEQLRFKERMIYSLEVDENIDTLSLKIPSQLIQPYVENAIWHGLMHKTEIGHVSIKIKLLKDQLNCIIEDNGIGRKMAENISNIYHKSSGMSINAQRLKLIEFIFKRPVKLMIEDLYNKEGEACGTRVNLIIPIINP